MPHYLIALDTDAVVYEIVEGLNAKDAIASSGAKVNGETVSVWTLRSPNPRKFKVVTETQTQYIPV